MSLRGHLKRVAALLVAAGILSSAIGMRAQTIAPPQPSSQAPAAGSALYESACAACHGIDGRGAPPGMLGFDVPVPDFTDCSFVTVEPDEDWMAVSHDGGPARAFDRRMPAFGDAMTGEELQQTLDYIRTFCDSPAWPRGDLNLPRALVTEKAFPENEAVLTTTVAANGGGEVGNEFLYEQRLGARSQFEVVVPLLVQEQADGNWTHGLGDVAVAFKHVLFHSLELGRIFSVAAEVILPTGKEDAGFGSGTTCSSRSRRSARFCRRTCSCRHRRDSSCPSIPTTPGARRSGGRPSARPSRRDVSAGPGRRWSSCSRRASWKKARPPTGTSFRRCRSR